MAYIHEQSLIRTRYPTFLGLCHWLGVQRFQFK